VIKFDADEENLPDMWALLRLGRALIEAGNNGFALNP
jgi:hypothetical protein